MVGIEFGSPRSLTLCRRLWGICHGLDKACSPGLRDAADEQAPHHHPGGHAITWSLLPPFVINEGDVKMVPRCL